MLTLTGLSAQSQHRVRVSAPMVLIALLRGCAIRRPDSGGPFRLQHSALSDSECQPSRCRDCLFSYRAGLVFVVLVGGVLVFAFGRSRAAGSGACGRSDSFLSHGPSFRTAASRCPCLRSPGVSIIALR